VGIRDQKQVDRRAIQKNNDTSTRRYKAIYQTSKNICKSPLALVANKTQLYPMEKTSSLSPIYTAPFEVVPCESYLRPIVVTLAAKLFWALCNNGPTARQLDEVLYPLVEKAGTPEIPTYGRLVAEVSARFGGAAWVEKGFREIEADCAQFSAPENLFETPRGRVLPLSWVKL
jgi:hypothetical protein